MVTNNSWNSEDPAQVAKGGTGIATTTPYGVITGGTTATGAFQNAGAGAVGQLLVSNGASALPSWANAGASGGSLVLISNQDVAAVTEVEFTSLGTYYQYLLVFRDVAIGDGLALFLQVSTDGGSTYDTTNNFGGIQYWDYDSATVSNLNTTTGFYLTGAISNERQGNGQLFFYGTDGSADYFSLNGNSQWLDNTSSKRAFGLFGGEIGLTTVDAVRIIPTSGNMSGKFSLYGLARV